MSGGGLKSIVCEEGGRTGWSEYRPDCYDGPTERVEIENAKTKGVCVTSRRTCLQTIERPMTFINSLNPRSKNDIQFNR